MYSQKFKQLIDTIETMVQKAVVTGKTRDYNYACSLLDSYMRRNF